MSLSVTILLPPDLEQKVRQATGDLNTEVTQAFALELFRRGTLSHAELARMLGLDRFNTDAFLKQHGVFEGSPQMSDLDADAETLRRVMGKAG
jgi:predicted HTH domain antitoxin